MTGISPHEITQLLRAWSGGNRAALDKLIPLVYDELHRLAHSYMRREPSGHILQTTALVNEAYLELVDAKNVNWHDRNHFFAIAARLMRQILVDSARSRNAQKRGGGIRRVFHVRYSTGNGLHFKNCATLPERLVVLYWPEPGVLVWDSVVVSVCLWLGRE